MLKLSRRVEYALMALLHIAELGRDELATNREIAAAYSIPPALLGKILQTLKRAGLVAATHGSRGGYRLGRPLAAITVGHVLEALDGPLDVAACAAGAGRRACGRAGRCNIRRLVAQCRQRLAAAVHRLPLTPPPAGPRPAANVEETSACVATIPKRPRRARRRH